MEAPKTKPVPVTSSVTAVTQQVVFSKNLPDWAKAEGEKHFLVCDGANDEKFQEVFPGSIDQYHWKEHPLPKDKDGTRRLARKQRERYETFCYGYLFFYDSQVNTAHPHSIFFDWEKRAGGVNIYISPAPKKLDEAKEFIFYSPEVSETDPPTPPAPPPPAMGEEEQV